MVEFLYILHQLPAMQTHYKTSVTVYTKKLLLFFYKKDCIIFVLLCCVQIHPFEGQ